MYNSEPNNLLCVYRGEGRKGGWSGVYTLQLAGLDIVFSNYCFITIGTSETRRQLKMAMKRGKGKTSITKVCYGWGYQYYRDIACKPRNNYVMCSYNIIILRTFNIKLWFAIGVGMCMCMYAVHNLSRLVWWLLLYASVVCCWCVHA